MIWKTFPLKYLMHGMWILLLLPGGCAPLVPLPSREALESERVDMEKRKRTFDDVKLLTVEQASEIALANNPDYLSCYYALQAAKMAYYQSLSAYLPTISSNFGVNGGWGDNNQLKNPPELIAPHDETLSTTVGIRGSYLLFDGLVREFSALAARHEWRREEVLEADVRRLLLRAVAYSYYDLLLAQEQLRIISSDVTYQKSNLAQAEGRFKAGDISKSDFLNFKILLNRSLSDEVIAQRQVAFAEYALAVLLGDPEGNIPEHVQFPPLQDNLEIPLMDVNFFLSQALEMRPDLQAYQEKLRIAEYEEYRAMGTFLPVIKADAGYGYDTNLHNYRDYGMEHRGWNASTVTLGVNAQWVLFDGFHRYNRLRQQTALTLQTKMQLDYQVLLIVQEVRNAFENFSTAVDQAGYLREMTQWVFEQRKLVTVEYWEGNVTITRLNEAQKELVSAESSLAIALVEMRKARAQLAAAVNGEITVVNAPRNIEQPNTPLEGLFDAMERQYQYGEDEPWMKK